MTASDSPNLTLMFKVTLEEVKKYSYEKKIGGHVKVGPRNYYPRIYWAWGWGRKRMQASPRSSGAELQCSRILWTLSVQENDGPVFLGAQGLKKTQFQVFLPIILFRQFVLSIPAQTNVLSCLATTKQENIFLQNTQITRLIKWHPGSKTGGWVLLNWSADCGKYLTLLLNKCYKRII